MTDVGAASGSSHILRDPPCESRGRVLLCGLHFEICPASGWRQGRDLEICSRGKSWEGREYHVDGTSQFGIAIEDIPGRYVHRGLTAIERMELCTTPRLTSFFGSAVEIRLKQSFVNTSFDRDTVSSEPLRTVLNDSCLWLGASACLLSSATLIFSTEGSLGWASLLGLGEGRVLGSVQSLFCRTVNIDQSGKQ